MKKTALSLVLSALGLLTVGCAEHRGYGYGARVYDPYYSDYHAWSPDEDRYYHTWYGETYRDRPYRDYRHIRRDDQRAYWNWRHQHGDRDHHDRDRDRDRH